MTVFIGVDIGASFHVASVYEEGKNWKKYPTEKITTNIEGYQTLLAMAERYQCDGENTHIALEPTGTFYSKSLAEFAKNSGWSVRYVENITLHRYRDMMGSPNKSDEMDARLLAHYIAHGHHTYKQQDELCQEMIFQYREIQGMKKQRTRYINRLHQCIKVTFPELKYKGSKQHRELLEVYPSAHEILKADPKELTKLQRATAAMAINSVGVDCPATKRRLKHCLKMIKLFDDAIETLESDLSETIKQHPDYEIVTSFPAINDITAAVIIGTYQDISKYPSRQCFKKRLGLAAEERTSGTSVSTTFINRRATGLVRTALHLVCISLVGPHSGQNVFKSYYIRRRENDPTRRPLLGRLKGKIAEMLYQCLKRRTPFDRTRNMELCAREMQMV